MNITTRNQLDAASFETFVTAGKATFTVVGRAARYTFKVCKSNDGQVQFVKVLSGFESDYNFIGTIARGKFFPKGWREGATAPASAVAFAWVWNHRANPAPAQVWHEGRCGRCGCKLTVPASIEGFCPECINHV